MEKQFSQTSGSQDNGLVGEKWVGVCVVCEVYDIHIQYISQVSKIQIEPMVMSQMHNQQDRWNSVSMNVLWNVAIYF